MVVGTQITSKPHFIPPTWHAALTQPLHVATPTFMPRLLLYIGTTGLGNVKGQGISMVQVKSVSTGIFKQLHMPTYIIIIISTVHPFAYLNLWILAYPNSKQASPLQSTIIISLIRII